jgi:hypothetical protein
MEEKFKDHKLMLPLTLLLTLDETVKLAYTCKSFYELFFQTKQNIDMFLLQKRFLG